MLNATVQFLFRPSCNVVSLDYGDIIFWEIPLNISYSIVPNTTEGCGVDGEVPKECNHLPLHHNICLPYIYVHSTSKNEHMYHITLLRYEDGLPSASLNIPTGSHFAVNWPMVSLFLCLIKHRMMNKHEEVEISLHVFNPVLSGSQCLAYSFFPMECRYWIEGLGGPRVNLCLSFI